jgi:hypothetical protein
LQVSYGQAVNAAGIVIVEVFDLSFLRSVESFDNTTQSYINVYTGFDSTPDHSSSTQYTYQPFNRTDLVVWRIRVNISGVDYNYETDAILLVSSKAPTPSPTPGPPTPTTVTSTPAPTPVPVVCAPPSLLTLAAELDSTVGDSYCLGSVTGGA